MNILIATGIFPPDIGGPATYSKLLSEELPKRGVDVSVVSFGEVRRYPKIIRHFIYFLKVFKKAKTVDIIFAQDTVSAALPAVFAAKLRGKRFVVRVPGDYAWEQSVQRYGVKDSIDDFQNKKYGGQVELLRNIQKFVVDRAHVVITPSIYFKNLVGKWVKDPNKVTHIYNGIDLNTLPSQSEYFQEKTIISAGRLVPWKGFKALIETLELLPEWRLAIAGSGSELENLKNIAKEKNVNERVTFLGQIKREDLLQKIADSEVFVLNTHFESFSFQIVEAMAVGTPVVATDVGNISELVDNNSNGVLVKPDDTKAIAGAVTRLSSDKNFKQQVIQSAKEKSKQFSINNTIDKLLENLKNI